MSIKEDHDAEKPEDKKIIEKTEEKTQSLKPDLKLENQKLQEQASSVVIAAAVEDAHISKQNQTYKQITKT